MTGPLSIRRLHGHAPGVGLRTAVSSVMLATAAVPAAAQAPKPPSIEVPAGQSFAHANSGVSLPAMLDGLPRTRIVENEAPQLDVAAEYATPDSGEVITVYVYRVTSGAVPVWFDRATWAIESRPIYGTPIRHDAPPAFVPPGQGNASAMIAAWALTGSRYRATALAIVPAGEWLVKLRYSSLTHDAAALDAGLRRAIEALGWPAKLPAAAAAAPVEDCATPLALKAKSKPARRDASSALLGAFLASVPAKASDTASAVIWCRDATRIDGVGVYRPGGVGDRYLYAFSDAGRGVWVAPSSLAALLGDKKAPPNWSVDLILPGRTTTYPRQDRLPDPAQIDGFLKGSAVSSVTTWGDKKRDITISPGAIK